jgi:hypothetical protein
MESKEPPGLSKWNMIRLDHQWLGLLRAPRLPSNKSSAECLGALTWATAASQPISLAHLLETSFSGTVKSVIGVWCPFCGQALTPRFPTPLLDPERACPRRRYQWRQITEVDSDPYQADYPHLPPLPSLFRPALVFQEFAPPIRSLLVCFHHAVLSFRSTILSILPFRTAHILRPRPPLVCLQDIIIQLIRKDPTSTPNFHHTKPLSITSLEP